MKNLETSGLPIVYDVNGVLELRNGIGILGTGQKFVKDMDGLLQDPNYLPPNEPYYDVYRGIMWEKDRSLFARTNKRYDITGVRANPEKGECKKTSGHFHAYLPGKTVSYPEVYEVLLGTATYILVKVKDHLAPVDELVVEDVRLVTVRAGETFVVPPNYGHASINTGDGPMLFNNICTLENKSDYRIVKHFHGMPYYITRENGIVTPVMNNNWSMPIPEPRRMHVRENAALGILFNNPVYNEFIKRPEVFSFLENPVDHVDEIMDMMVDD